MATVDLSVLEFNAKVVAEFRANGGYGQGPLAGFALILIHHVGARSGVERIVPLVRFATGDGRWMVVASNGGSSAHPAWYHNLKAHPRVTAELGAETFEATAEELDPHARSLVWPAIVERSPAVREFQSVTTRMIPVFVLTRQ